MSDEKNENTEPSQEVSELDENIEEAVSLSEEKESVTEEIQSEISDVESEETVEEDSIAEDETKAEAAAEEIVDNEPASEEQTTDDKTDSEEVTADEADATEEAQEEATEKTESEDKDADEEEAEEAWQVPKEELKKIIEGIIFVSSRVLTLNSLCNAVPDAKRAEVREVIKELIEKYQDDGRGFHLEEINKGYQFRSDSICAPFIREMLKSRPTRLSRPALETLAIVAYRQPVTRADIEDIRGVDAGGVLKTLLEKKLVKILGKLEEPGRPMIYGTTKDFLETFHMRALSDLPTLQEFQELSEEHQAIVDATYSRDEVAKAEEEQDNMFAVPESRADETASAKDLMRAAENLEMAVKTVDETVDEIMNRTPYDEQDEDDQDDQEVVAEVEIIAGAELMNNNTNTDEEETRSADETDSVEKK